MSAESLQQLIAEVRATLDRDKGPTGEDTDGRLRHVVTRAKAAAGCRNPELMVLARQNDPYFVNDEALAGWFAEQVARWVPSGTIHLRGLFYRVVAAGNVAKLDGAIFTNTEANWRYLGIGAKHARWLGYVPFERIIDERNAAPELFIPEAKETGWQIRPGLRAEVYGLEACLPDMAATFAVCQPYRIIFIGEKVSLAMVLRPIAEEVGGEMLLPTGEISDTLIAGMARRAAEDGRPAVVLYFSDFDPAGHQMPVSVARKLQALRDLRHPSLRIEVHHIGLTLAQVRAFELPSTPLKETERRADKWREAMGHEQTEIDAMLALHPGELDRIAREAVAPFHDATLAERIEEAEAECLEEANEWLAAYPGFEGAKAEIAEARNLASQAIQKLTAAQSRLEETVEGIEMPEMELPGLETAGAAPLPLFTTEDGFMAATRRLKEYRAYSEDDAA
ncbi:MAG: hypothetical protein ACREFZ_00860 [Acetobacteraceae bacterium]